LLNGWYYKTTWLSRYQNVKPFWVSPQQDMMEVAAVPTGVLGHAVTYKQTLSF